MPRQGDLAVLDWEEVMEEFIVYTELLRTGIGCRREPDPGLHMR